MTTDQIIALLASIGACLSAIATFWTVRQVAKQREYSYRPELTLASTVLDGFSDSVTTSSFPTRWVNRTSSGDPESASRGFGVTLTNVGLGAAKAITVSWLFPFEEFVKQINETAQRTLTPVYFTFDGISLDVKSDNLGNSISIWKNQRTESIDYVLPAVIQGDPVTLKLPHAYIQVVSAILFLSLKDKDRKSSPRIPNLEVDIEYLDIGERRHKAKFFLEIEVIALGGDGKFIQAHLKSKKCA